MCLFQLHVEFTDLGTAKFLDYLYVRIIFGNDSMPITSIFYVYTIYLNIYSLITLPSCNCHILPTCLMFASVLECLMVCQSEEMVDKVYLLISRQWPWFRNYHRMDQLQALFHFLSSVLFHMLYSVSETKVLTLLI